jgi:hypothetical protein
MEISESPHKMHMPWGNFFRQAKMVSAYDVYMLAIILHIRALLTDSAYAGADLGPNHRGGEIG